MLIVVENFYLSSLGSELTSNLILLDLKNIQLLYEANQTISGR
jgi:hypothetical protein